MQTRRSILLALTAALPAVLWRGRAGAASRTLLAEAEPAAVAIGYKANATKVDAQQFPAYRRGQTCANCALMEFGTGVQRGCTAVPGRLVMAPGWCKLWVQRAAR